MMIRSSPTAMPSRPRAADGPTSIQASGAPSEPCLGASARVLLVDRMMAIGLRTAGCLRCLTFVGLAGFLFVPLLPLIRYENFPLTSAKKAEHKREKTDCVNVISSPI